MLLKPDREEGLLYSNIEGESILFGIGDPSIIIDIIRKKIYNHPIRTLVQEYLSNAKDACVEAGKKSSDIHVTLPTSLNPEFVIRDFGVGMSDERVREVFVQYGISTKRESNKQLGCFGIGAKSGWAYSDSFIVESFYNGIHREYIADIAHTKEGRLLLFKESETEEPNGVLIKIPVEVKDIQSFKTAYIRATLLWKDRPVLKDPICYPELVFSYDDIKVFKGFSSYTKNDDSMTSGVYLNGQGIPFLIEHIFNKTMKEKYSNWCLNYGYALFIEADPFRMGISANREGFVNQNYASAKAERAYTKLSEYAQNIFKPALLKDYLQLYKTYYWLISLDAKKNFLQDKQYSISMYSVDSQINVSLVTGYFLRLVTKSIFTKQIRSDISFGTKWINEIYLSKSKGLWNNVTLPLKDIKIAPELSEDTKKALTYGRALDNTHSRYVFFQGTLADEDYSEIAQILGATEYIEDLYQKNIDAFKAERKKERLASKEQRDKKRKERLERKAQEGPVIKVYHFRRQYTKLTKCGREKSVTNLYHLLPVYYLIFYGDHCEKWYYNFLKTLPFEIAIVYALKADIEDIKKLNDPKLKPLEEFQSYIKNDQTILKAISECSRIRGAKEFWRFFNLYKIVSKKFDITKLKEESSAILKHLNRLEESSIHCHNQGEYTKYYTGQNIFDDFMKIYPLLKNISRFDSTVVEDINLYIKAVDERTT
jgi:hypothetical protein